MIARLKAYDGRLGRSQLAAAGLAGSCLLLLLFVIGVHLPLQRAASEYRSEMTRTTQEINRVVNFRNAHLDRKAYQKELDSRAEQARQALPETMGQAGFLLETERLAENSALQLKRIQPGELVQGEGRQSLSVRLCLQGSYFSLLRFMNGLQAGARLIIVKSMDVKEENGQLLAELVVNIYAVPDK